MTKEELLKRNLLWLSDMKIQKDNDKVWAQFTSTDFTKSIYTAMQEYSDQQNSSLIKEVEELKALSGCLKNTETVIRNREHILSELSKKEETISQLKETLEKILDPIKFLRMVAEKEGAQLNGLIAIQLSNDPNYLKSIATQALKEKE